MLFKNFIAKLIILYFLLLILFPLPLFYKVLKYDIGTVYIALISSFFLIPIIFFLSKSYWKKKITIIIWCLRIFMVVIFLLVSCRTGITMISIIPFLGTLSLTFFYELGYLILSIGYFKKFLKYWIWLNTAICIYLLLIVFPLFLKYGSGEIVHSQVGLLNTYHSGWPNYFGIYLVLLFWLVICFGQRNKKYFLLLLFVLPTLFFTFSRTAFLALFASILFPVFFREKRSFASTFIFVILILALFLPTGYVVFKSHYTDFSSLSSLFVGRQERWEGAISLWQKHPFLGYGFASFTELVPEFSSSIIKDEELLKMGSSHNDYVDLLTRGGLLYSLAFWAFVLYLVWQGLIKRNNKELMLKYISYSIIALLVSAFFQNPFKDPPILALFWSYVAAVAYYTDEVFNKKKFILN